MEDTDIVMRNTNFYNIFSTSTDKFRNHFN